MLTCWGNYVYVVDVRRIRNKETNRKTREIAEEAPDNTSAR